MKLRGRLPFRSIPAFPIVELPPFVVLTGINGSGKSQFLEAITTGNIAVDLFPHFELDKADAAQGILRLGPGISPPLKFDPVDPGFLPNRTINSQRPEVTGFERFHDEVTAGAWDSLVRLAGDKFDPQAKLRSEVWREGPQAFIERLGLSGNSAASVFDAFAQAEAAFAVKMLARATPAEFRLAIQRAADRLGKSALAVTPDEARSVGAWGEHSAYAPEITQIFSLYRDARIYNRFDQIAFEDGDSQSSFLSPDEFLAKYGQPPWQLLSEILLSFGLNYEAVAPHSHGSVKVEFKLRRLDTQVEVSPEKLSSGEQVLLRFALSLFPFDPVRVNLRKPKLLLLDEMDASLHPEMVSRWFRAIQDGLIQKEGAACILTTHSPTTVALAPEGSLFELEYGVGRPQEVSKQRALNRLTVGVPTLAIDFSGQRQVFVESDTDAANYQALAAFLKGELELPKTLSFLPTGVRKPDKTESGTGCAAVRRVVSELRKGGNQSVFGLIDWDGKNQPADHIFILAQDTHYTLENILLHPLLIAALMLRERVAPRGFKGTFASLGDMTDGELQSLADAVQRPLNYPDEYPGDTEGQLLGGAKIVVRNAHMAMKGHDLEELLVAAHPGLPKLRRRGQLAFEVVDGVIRDFPKFCPTPIANAFTAISTAAVQ